jgi:hypothetical protein
LAAVLIPLLAAATASAQPYYAPPPDAPPPPPAPMTAPQQDPNVSQINGQLVPVGQHNDYLYQFKKTNISTNPIGWLAGYYGVSLSYAISNNVVLRADANIIHNAFGSQGDDGYEVGVSLPIYLRRAYQGPFVEPGLIARGSSNGDDVMSSASVGPEMLIGYQWTFDSGFNIAAAGGLAKLSNDSDDEGGIAPAGYFRVGYAF